MQNLGFTLLLAPIRCITLRHRLRFAALTREPRMSTTRFQVVIRLSVFADGAVDAQAIGEAAAEHLFDTFNDNDSIDSDFSAAVEQVQA